jgi:hypothetical protein
MVWRLALSFPNLTAKLLDLPASERLQKVVEIW